MADKKIGMVIYRYNDKEDLEVLLVGDDKQDGAMRLPKSEFNCCEDFEQGTGIPATDNEDVIELEGIEENAKGGLVHKAIALEEKMEQKP